jgi:hypothetical protein
MTAFKIIAIPTQVAEFVRINQKAPRYLHPAYTEVARGYGPCRHCLRTFRIGEEQRTLFTYDPFAKIEDLPLPGPVFIHTEACERYAEEGGYPGDMRQFASVLDAYGKGLRLVEQVYAAAGEAEERIRNLLERPEVDYIEVRDREAGCFDFRVERG